MNFQFGYPAKELAEAMLLVAKNSGISFINQSKLSLAPIEGISKKEERILRACRSASVSLPISSEAVFRAFNSPMRKQLKMRTREFIAFKLSLGLSI